MQFLLFLHEFSPIVNCFANCQRMRAVIQRVASRASVTGKYLNHANDLVDTEIVSAINRGLCVLVGVGIGCIKSLQANRKTIL